MALRATRGHESWLVRAYGNFQRDRLLGRTQNPPAEASDNMTFNGAGAFRLEGAGAFRLEGAGAFRPLKAESMKGL